MNEEYLKKVETEVEGLRYVCKKIIQAYRIRMKLFLTRYKLLIAIDKDFANIANNPNFYTILNNTLKRERKLLKIIEGDEKKVGNNIAYALMQLEKYNSKFGGELNNTRLQGWARKLSGRDISIFLQRMISFLNQMEHDLKGIETRMNIEEDFIRERNLKYFGKFIRAWEEEMEAHEKMIKDFKRALNASQKIIILGESEGIGIGTSVGVASATASALTGIALKSTTIAVLGGAVGAAVVMVGLLMYFMAVSKMGLQYVFKEERLIRDFEKKRGMEKHPFWHKLSSIFGTLF